MQEDSPDPSQWEVVIGLIQTDFHEGHLAEDCARQTFILIQNRNGDFRSIGMVEVLWKTVMGILNCRLISEIQCYDTLHGFRTGKGARNASLEAKLIQYHMGTREEVLYEIFLDIHNYYDALDRDCCLDILEACGVVPWSLFLLRRYWDRLTMVARAG